MPACLAVARIFELKRRSSTATRTMVESYGKGQGIDLSLVCALTQPVVQRRRQRRPKSPHHPPHSETALFFERDEIGRAAGRPLRLARAFRDGGVEQTGTAPEI